ncbi:MAG: Holliday junction branch migration protein RuvA [Candidatus Magasanikbacteria bacterium]|jgi:holliday junction DNA helicase RuvA|nr:Holliday junction branch migration protein RuvA [Candidatus Magasanikbacteria bacterium]
MIALLKGTVAHRTAGSIVLMTSGGVGYDVRVSVKDLTALPEGTTVTLMTYLKVSDSALDLYGFTESSDRAFFELLLTVKGVGPKGALNILGLGSLDQIQEAIGRGDAAYLRSVPGLGKKTADRLVVELKSKVGSVQASAQMQQTGVSGDVVGALVSMGYSEQDAFAAVQHAYVEGASVEDVLKQSLQFLSSK